MKRTSLASSRAPAISSVLLFLLYQVLDRARYLSYGRTPIPVVSTLAARTGTDRSLASHADWLPHAAFQRGKPRQSSPRSRRESRQKRLPVLRRWLRPERVRQ